MNKGINYSGGFTLTDLLAIIAVLSLLMLTALAQPKSRVTQTSCANNLRQVGQAIQMFADENSDYLPPGAGRSDGLWTGQTRIYNTTATYSLVYYIATYMGEPAPKGMVMNEVKAFSCPAFERETKFKSATNLVVFGLNTPGIPDASGTKTNNVNFSPFGYPAGAGGGQTPHRIAEIPAQKPLAQVYSMIDADQWAYPTTAWFGDLPSKPVHGRNRNALYFDGHASPRAVGPTGTL